MASTSGSAASIVVRRRGTTKNEKQQLLDHHKGPIPVEIKPDSMRVTGEYEDVFKDEIESIVGDALIYESWAAIPDNEKQAMRDKVKEAFQVDLTDPHHTEVVKMHLENQFNDDQQKLKSYWKKFDPNEAPQHPYTDVQNDVWLEICNRFKSEEDRKNPKGEDQPPLSDASEKIHDKLRKCCKFKKALRWLSTFYCKYISSRVRVFTAIKWTIEFILIILEYQNIDSKFFNILCVALSVAYLICNVLDCWIHSGELADITFDVICVITAMVQLGFDVGHYTSHGGNGIIVSLIGFFLSTLSVIFENYRPSINPTPILPVSTLQEVTNQAPILPVSIPSTHLRERGKGIIIQTQS